MAYYQTRTFAGDTAPPTPNEGDIWVNSTTGDLQVAHAGTFQAARSFAGRLTLNGFLNLGAVGAALAVASNVIAPTHSFHLIDSSGGTVTVKTITPGIAAADGDIITFMSNNANDVTFDETGNIDLGGSTRVLSDTGDTITFIYNATISKYCEIGFGDNV